jgi:Uma2 family endonuclease
MFGSDMKLCLSMNAPDSTYFSYPDAMIVCDQKGSAKYGWRERPAAIFEIISESTRHIDEREKKLAYLQIPSLEAYVRIEQSRPEAVIDFRTLEGWKRERIIGLDGVIRLPSLEVEFPMSELYERVIFGSEENA